MAATASALLGIVAWVVLLGWAAPTFGQVAQPSPARTSDPARPAGYVGAEVCGGCHAREAALWRESDHARAMAPATEASVRGDFADATAPDQRMLVRFFRRDGRYFVNAEGRDGQPHDFEITHTFGVDPLQQYLVSLPDGRRQAFWIAWDARGRDQGGQRWFRLYPSQAPPPGDPLHWTGRDLNWNFMCADCHSTALRRNFDLATNRYATTFAEVNVACESCHGAGAAHVAWARGATPRPPDPALPIRFRREPGTWSIADQASGIAHWAGPPRDSARGEVELCAQCHALRRPIVAEPGVGHPLLDTHVPTLLDRGTYHADGQVLGEAFEYGSFIQSRMAAAGVTCSDCHEPHGARLRVEGNALCAQCHAPARFDAPGHHRHAEGGAGSQCVDCHMAPTTFMIVDARRDHSFRVPRPDQSAALGVPNACTRCHTDRTDEWAAMQVGQWFGPGRRQEPGFAAALDAGRRGLANAEMLLVQLIVDRAQPAIARATALSLMPAAPGRAGAGAIQAALADPDPLVRGWAARTMEPAPPALRARALAPLLNDPVRFVRIEAARALADIPAAALAPDRIEPYHRAFAALVESEMVAAERPESHVNLASLYRRGGRVRDAESALRAALRLDPDHVPALINLADLSRASGREADGEALLMHALRVEPESGEALHALGLLRVRQRRLAEALDLLRRAAAARPDVTQYAYVYAIALNASGFGASALDTLRQAHARDAANRDVLFALATIQRDRGDLAGAERDAERLVALAPDDQRARALLGQIRALRQRR